MYSMTLTHTHALSLTNTNIHHLSHTHTHARARTGPAAKRTLAADVAHTLSSPLCLCMCRVSVSVCLLSDLIETRQASPGGPDSLCRASRCARAHLHTQTQRLITAVFTLGRRMCSISSSALWAVTEQSGSGGTCGHSGVTGRLDTAAQVDGKAQVKATITSLRPPSSRPSRRVLAPAAAVCCPHSVREGSHELQQLIDYSTY